MIIRNTLLLTRVKSQILFSIDSRPFVTEEQMQKVVVKLQSASCLLDPVPLKTLKKYISSLSPILTKITNISLSMKVVWVAMCLCRRSSR